MQIQISQGDAVTIIQFEDNSKEAELVQNWWHSTGVEIMPPISLLIIVSTIGLEAYTSDPAAPNRHCLTATSFVYEQVKELKKLVNSLIDTL